MVDQARIGMSNEDFNNLPDNAECIDGEVILNPPAQISSAILYNRLLSVLLEHEGVQFVRMAYIVSTQGGHILRSLTSGNVIPGFEVKAATLYA